MRLAQLEAAAAVQAVRSLTGGAGGEVDGTGPDRAGVGDGRLDERLPGALAAGGGIDDDVLHPGAQTGGDREGRQSEHAQDRASAVCSRLVRPEDEQVDALLRHEGLALLGGQRRSRAGELGNEALHRLDELRCGLGNDLNSHGLSSYAVTAFCSVLLCDCGVCSTQPEWSLPVSEARAGACARSRRALPALTPHSPRALPARDRHFGTRSTVAPCVLSPHF